MKFEYKYIIPNEILPTLHNQITHFLEKDTNMENYPDGYTVRSIYFDTLSLNDYHDKKDGIKKRKKIRIRGYNNSRDIVFLEVKHKDEKSIYKKRAPIKFENLEDLLNSKEIEKYILDQSKFEDYKAFLYFYSRTSLSPVILIVYEREAFFGKFNQSFRITIDKNIRSSMKPKIMDLYNEDRTIYYNPNISILEVKFSEVFPSWLKPILSSFDIRKVSFSKYTECLDKHNIIKNGYNRYFLIP